MPFFRLVLPPQTPIALYLFARNVPATCPLLGSEHAHRSHHLFLQLVPDEVPSPDDLPDLEDPVCLEALRFAMKRRYAREGESGW